MKVKVKLFASYRDKIKQSEVEVELPTYAKVGSLATEMVRCYPSLTTDATKLVVAVNQEFRCHDFVLTDGDEVALIPPVSGGIS